MVAGTTENGEIGEDVPVAAVKDGPSPISKRAKVGLTALCIATTITLCAIISAFTFSGLWSIRPIMVSALTATSVMLPAIAAILWLRRRDHFIEAFSNRPDSEHEQIIVRINVLAVSAGFLGIVAWRNGFDIGHVDTLIVAATFQLACWLFLIHIMHFPGQSTPRRILGIFADQLVLTSVLVSGDENAASLFPFFLWVTLGHGFRFGVKFLLIAAFASAVGFCYVIWVSAYWQENLQIAIGLLFSLVVLPAYVTPLIGRLNRARAQAEEANRSKGRFLATMSHELRTPLTAIIGMSSLLKSTTIDNDQRSMVAAVDTSAQSLLDLINEILDFSKVEAGKLSLDIDEFDLHEVVAKVWMMLHGQAEQKGLRLRVSIDPAAAHRIRGDAKRITQILINLVGNAIKFTESGEVELALHVQGAYSGEMLIRFEVNDTGIGIAPDKQATVFEGFTQADDSIGRRFGGTGLGLAISKQLIELMGGRIGVQSEPGSGSTFWLSVPFEVVEGKPEKTIESRGVPVILVSSDQEVTDRLFLKLASWLVEPLIVECAETLRSIFADEAAMSATIVVVNDRDEDPLVSTFAELIRGRKPEAHPAVVEMVRGADRVSNDMRDWPVSVALKAADEDDLLRNALHAALAIKAPWGVDAGLAEDGAEAGLSSFGQRAEHKGRRILLAEDNNTNRMVITRVLENAGHEVVPAEDGDRALDLLSREDFDLAFMDVNMPGTNGLEVVKMHRVSEAGGPRLPIVALTADATEQARQDCAEAGMDDYLTKPVDPDLMYAMIVRWTPDHPGGEVDVPQPVDPDEPAETVTPISQHPRFQITTEPVIDRKALDALRTLDNDGAFFTEVLTEFLADADLLLSDMEAASGRKDAVEFKDAAHSLRSSANHVGASRMVKMLLELRDARANELGDVGIQTIKSLRGEFAKVRTRLERELGQARKSKSGSK